MALALALALLSGAAGAPVATVDSPTATVVRVAPSDCRPLTDCRATIAAAVDKCRAASAGGQCSVLLASGDYRVIRTIWPAFSHISPE